MTSVFLYLEMYVLDVYVKASKLEVTVGANSAVLSETWPISGWELLRVNGVRRVRVGVALRGEGFSDQALNMNFVR